MPDHVRVQHPRRQRVSDYPSVLIPGKKGKGKFKGKWGDEKGKDHDRGGDGDKEGGGKEGETLEVGQRKRFYFPPIVVGEEEREKRNPSEDLLRGLRL